MKKTTGNNVDLYRQSLYKRIRKLIRKANMWCFFENGNLGVILALITVVSGCFVWLPGIWGAVITKITLASLATVIATGIARRFVHKSKAIEKELTELWLQLHAYDFAHEREKEETVGFNYLTKTEISRNNCSSEEEYITKKSDDQFILDD